MEQKTDAGTPALGLSLQVQLDKSRVLVLQSHVERECSDEDLNATLDKWARASDRQAARYELETERAELVLVERQYRQLADDLQRVDESHQKLHIQSGRKGPFKPNEKERQERMNVTTTQKRFHDDIEARKQRIAVLEAKVGVKLPRAANLE